MEPVTEQEVCLLNYYKIHMILLHDPVSNIDNISQFYTQAKQNNGSDSSYHSFLKYERWRETNRQMN